MESEFNWTEIKNFLKQNKTILFFIVFLAYLIRILPYLLGYTIPFTEDGLRDFQQVKYIIDYKQIDFSESYQSYGSFPLLHLVVVAISNLGFDPLTAFLFFPQMLASLGIAFYYLFLKKYFSTKQTLWACFLIAVFIPHIHWSAQPVRETLGLFFFPLIIYLFDKAVTENDKKIKYLFWLIISFILIMPTHHWSAIMTLTWLISFTLFFVKGWKKIIYASFLIIIFILLNAIYWYYLFPLSFTLIKNLLVHTNWAQITTVVILSFLIIIFKKINFDKLKNRDNKRNVFLLIVIFLWLVASTMLPLNYPLQIWLDFILFLLFIFVGFFYHKNDNLNKLMAITIFYSFFILMVLTFNVFQNVHIYSLPFDPFRTFEFAIFPLSIIAALGFLKITKKTKYSQIVMSSFLIFLATLTYPPIFVYGHSFINTPFYDIRGNIRYITNGEMDLIKWANDRGYNVESYRPEIRSYQATFYPLQNKKIIIITLSDEILKEKYDYIYDPIVRVSPYEKNTISDDKIIYRNKDGYIANLEYNAEFVSQEIPEKLIIGSEVTFTIIMKNTGDISWNPNDNYYLKNSNDAVVIKLKELVAPGQTAIFSKKIKVPNIETEGKVRFKMYKKDLGFFGELTPVVNLKTTRE